MNGGTGVTSGGDRLRRLAPYAVTAGLLAVAVAGNLASIADQMARSGRPVTLFVPLLDELTSALVWLALLPAIGRIFELAAPPRVFRWAIAPIHLAVIPVVCLIHFTATRVLRAAFFALGGQDFHVWFSWRGYAADLYRDVLTYLFFGLIYLGARRLFDARARGRENGDALHAEPALVIEVRDGAQTLYLQATEVLWIEAAGNYVTLHASGGREILMRVTLASLARRLDAAGFLRIHRSRLVNPVVVAAVENLPAGDAALLLTSGARISASRRYRPALAAALAARTA